MIKIPSAYFNSCLLFCDLNINYENKKTNNIIEDIWKIVFTFCSTNELLLLRGVNKCCSKIILNDLPLINKQLLDWKKESYIFKNFETKKDDNKKVAESISTVDIKGCKIMYTLGDQIFLYDIINNLGCSLKFHSKNEAKYALWLDSNRIMIQNKVMTSVFIQLFSDDQNITLKKQTIELGEIEHEIIHSNQNVNKLFASITNTNGATLKVYDSLGKIQKLIKIEGGDSLSHEYHQLILSEKFVYVTYKDDKTYYLQAYCLDKGRLKGSVRLESEIGKVILGECKIILSKGNGKISILKEGELIEERVILPAYISKNQWSSVVPLMVDCNDLYIQSSNDIIEVWDIKEGEFKRKINLEDSLEKNSEKDLSVNSMITNKEYIFIAHKGANNIGIWNKAHGFYISKLMTKKCPKEIKIEGNQLIARFEESPWIQYWTTQAETCKKKEGANFSDLFILEKK